MTTQVIVRYSAYANNLQRIELIVDRLVVDGALFGDYSIVNADTAYATETVHSLWKVGDRMRQSQLDHLTFATPLEAWQEQVDSLKDILELAFYQRLDSEPNSTHRDTLDESIAYHKVLLAQAEKALEQQQELSSREHYFTNSDFIIQVDQPMIANDGMLAGTWTLLAGECSFARFMAFDPHDTDDCLEAYACWPVRYAYPSNNPTMIGEETVAMNQAVLALVEQAVAAKGLEVQIPSEKLLDCHFHHFGNWDHWYALMRWETTDRHNQAVFRHTELMLVFPQQFEIRTKCIKALV